ncbi:MAG: putative colanic acid biosynthesis acetyltransferase [Gemmataceae bacterium]
MTAPPDLSGYRNRLGLRNKLARVLWGGVWLFLFRPSPRPLHGWRRFLLRCFGARVGTGAHPYPSAKVWAPWNLTMGAHSCLADGVECYSVAAITLGPSALVSQRAFLCGATHDYTDPAFPLVPKPITIGAGAWVAAEAFVGPGVTVGDGSVVGARAVVTKDVEAWAVVAGNPARVVKRRTVQTGGGHGNRG